MNTLAQFMLLAGLALLLAAFLELKFFGSRSNSSIKLLFGLVFSVLGIFMIGVGDDARPEPKPALVAKLLDGKELNWEEWNALGGLNARMNQRTFNVTLSQLEDGESYRPYLSSTNFEYVVRLKKPAPRAGLQK